MKGNKASLLLGFLFAFRAFAQLLSCSDVGCPPDSRLNDAWCEVDDEIISSIGVTSMNTSIHTEPLAWTVALSRGDLGPGDLTTFHKEFYIGQPSSLNLKEIATISGCALMFTGATLQFAPNLTLSQMDDENGSCADALPAQCVTDLLSEAQNLVGKTELQSGSSMDCATLAQFLSARMPSTCPSSFGSTDEIATPSKSLILRAMCSDR